MKKKLTLVTFAAAFAAMFGMDLDLATAQFATGPRLGNQVQEPDTFRQVATDLNVGLPGRLWVSTNFADEGLGYNGSYVTVGGKRRLFEDFLDGRWLTEARLHHSIEDDGGFFANVGIERVFSIKSAQSDIVVGGWYDFDGDEQGNFGNDFSQIGINAAIKTRRWDLVGNGYFPIGTRNFTTGGGIFLGNNIQLAPGINSALTGFDVTLRLRPKQLAFMNGALELGGYGYSSDLVNSFGGGRVRLSAQTRRGFSVGVEVNHDDRFRTTGSLGIGYVFGAKGAVGGEYSSLGRDLEETIRNDHIVRFSQDIELAIDPDTGAAFNVVHVNNTADGTIGDGSAETPFDELVDAELNSSPGDIIYVNVGDGTDFLYDQGITLQDDQFLFSTGARNLLQTAQGTFVFNDAGVGATISNAGGTEVVRLADNNVIGGVNIDATGADNGIFASGVTDGTINGTTITGAINDGLLATNVSGDWVIQNTTASNNGRDGLHFLNSTADSITLNSNTTNTNSRHGIFLDDAITDGGTIDIVSTTSNGNAGFGVIVAESDGNLNIVDATINNNTVGGIVTRNVTNSDPNQGTFVGISDGGVSSVSGNRAGANLEFELDGDDLTQDVLVTGLTIDDGGRGIVGSTDGDNTLLNIDIIDTVSISDNDNDGILLTASGGSTIDTNILSTTGVPLQIVDNGIISGDGISLNATGTDVSLPPSRIISDIDNVRIQLPGNSSGGNGIGIASTGNAVAESDINNVDIERILVGDGTVPNNFNVNGNGLITGGDFGISLVFANSGGGDVNHVDVSNSTIEADNGIFLSTAANTFADLSVADSVIQAAGPRAVGRGPGLNNPTGTNFGDVGIQVLATGDATDIADDNLTRVTVDRTLIQDFSGLLSTGLGDPAFNGLNEALQGAAVDAFGFGDANLLLTLRGNQILNNGSGHNLDADGDGFFGEGGVSAAENPGTVLFYDAVSVNALDSSVISTRISGNFFQDNFERAISLDTYDNATINAQVSGNAFDNNDRGNDPGRGTFRFNPVGLNQPFNSNALIESQNFDFEAINNEEFFQRAFESPLAIDPSAMNNGVIDNFPLNAMGMPMGNNIADQSFNNPAAESVFVNSLTLGTAQLNLDVGDGEPFEFGALLLNFGPFTTNFQLNGIPAPPGITPVGDGLVDSLISNEEDMFNLLFNK